MKKIETRDVVNILATIVLPPLGVAMKTGFGGHFLLNLVLTLFGFYVVGLVHGLYVVLQD